MNDDNDANGYEQFEVTMSDTPKSARKTAKPRGMELKVPVTKEQLMSYKARAKLQGMTLTRWVQESLDFCVDG